MKDYYLFSETSSIRVEKDSRGYIKFYTNSNESLPFFKPENLIKQLEELAEYIKKYGKEPTKM